MEWVTQFLSDWWIAHYDPWYGWILFGFLVSVAVSWAAWFFPVLRSLAGAIVFGIAGTLAGMRKGQMIERDRQDARDRQRERTNPEGGWWWTKPPSS